MAATREFFSAANFTPDFPRADSATLTLPGPVGGLEMIVEGPDPDATPSPRRSPTTARCGSASTWAGEPSARPRRALTTH